MFRLFFALQIYEKYRYVILFQSIILYRTHVYYEIKHVLADYDFVNLQGSVYLTTNPSLANLYNAIQALSSIEWFRNSVRDIRGFKVEDWSDFTDSVKHPEKNMRKPKLRRR